MKRIWMSTLISNKETVQKLMAEIKPYGLMMDGHFWTDDLEKIGWMPPRKELLDPKTDLWMILTSADEMLKPSIRYGLSMLALAVQANREAALPIVILQTAGDPISAKTLTTPFTGAEVISYEGAGPGAKLVAKVHKTAEKIGTGYRFDVYGHEQIGQWFEVGPSKENWKGAMFGVSGGEIAMHAVGTQGRLPEKSVLNYPMEGMKLALGEEEYIAWAVQNPLNTDTSYYIKVKGYPSSIVFGPLSEEEAADVYVIKLK